MQVDGSKIRRLREDKGMTARDLSAAVAISPAHLSLIENGRRNPGPHVIARIATKLNVAIVELRRS